MTAIPSHDTLWIAACVSQSLVAISLIHVLLTARFYYMTRRTAPQDRPEHSPKAAVILSLRGADAYLPEALRGLFTQQYAAYSVRIVVDSRQDPAYAVAQQMIAECRADHVELEVLQQRSSACSLKCNALIQAVSGLDESFEVLAFIDADVIPHPTWLCELVAPFADPRVGMTTGNRWYVPQKRLFSSLVRTAWYGSAFMQMSVFGIAWGGTMAIRRRLADQERLVEKWGRAFNDDIVAAEAVRAAGKEVRFVPELVMVNREDTVWTACQAWVTRQLFHTRHYQRNWPAVAGLGFASMVLILAICVLVPVCTMNGQPAAALMALCGLAGYLGIMAALWLVISYRVRQLASRRVERVNVIGWWHLLPAVIGAHVIFGLGLCSALLRRNITWRGVSYRVDGPWKVQVVNDVPYAGTPVPQQTGLSL